MVGCTLLCSLVTSSAVVVVAPCDMYCSGNYSVPVRLMLQWEGAVVGGDDTPPVDEAVHA